MSPTGTLGRGSERSGPGNAPAPPGRRGAGTAVVCLVVGSVLALGITGAVLVNDLIQSQDERAAEARLADPGTPGLPIGSPVRASFGAITLAEAFIDNGLSSEDLGGMNHGVSGLVSQGNAAVTVVVTVQNTTQQPVLVQASQFHLLTSKPGRKQGKPLVATTTSREAGLLPGRSAVDVRVTFVTATDGSTLRLTYSDPGRPAPMRFALGTTAQIAAPKDHVH
jgi:hypothetical protein